MDLRFEWSIFLLFTYINPMSSVVRFLSVYTRAALLCRAAVEQLAVDLLAMTILMPC